MAVFSPFINIPIYYSPNFAYCKEENENNPEILQLSITGVPLFIPEDQIIHILSLFVMSLHISISFPKYFLIIYAINSLKMQSFANIILILLDTKTELPYS